MATINLLPQLFTANQWFFSAPTTVPSNIKSARIQATDPLNQWFTRPGNVKAFGLQLEGYVGGPWDNQAPWLGWGWWSYCTPEIPSGDVKAALILPQYWTAFGRSFKNNGVTLPLWSGIDAGTTIALAGQRVRMAVLTDADITLGGTLTLS